MSNICFPVIFKNMSDEFNIDCSDDEFKDHKGPWEPSPEELDKLYTMISNGEMPELNWKCPGYRPPTPEIEETHEEDSIETKPVEDKSDFDFMDEMNTPKLKIRRDGEDALKGSAKKKTTSLDGVINNMKRHNKTIDIPKTDN